MATTRFIVVRHGETAWNLEGRYQGHLDSPLTPGGVTQGHALAERLARHSFHSLYSSDLERAAHTAQVIAARTGHVIITDRRLRERNLGILQGLTRADAEQRYAEEFRLFKRGGPDYVIPKGESARQHADSVAACFAELARRHAGEQIAVVTHGGVLSALFRHVLGLSLEAPRHFKRLNGSWNVFSCENGKWFLDTWGDVSHLTAME